LAWAPLAPPLVVSPPSHGRLTIFAVNVLRSASREFDPVGAGFVDSLARPGSNASEFITLEYGLSAK
jgi:hypothetical protein